MATVPNEDELTSLFALDTVHAKETCETGEKGALSDKAEEDEEGEGLCVSLCVCHVYFSVSVCVSVTCISVCMSVCVSVCVCPRVCLIYLCASVCITQCVCLPVCLHGCLSGCLCVCLSRVSQCVCLCVPVCLYCVSGYISVCLCASPTESIPDVSEVVTLDEADEEPAMVIEEGEEGQYVGSEVEWAGGDNWDDESELIIAELGTRPNRG